MLRVELAVATLVMQDQHLDVLWRRIRAVSNQGPSLLTASLPPSLQLTHNKSPLPTPPLQAGRDEAAVARAAKDEAQAAKRERLKAAFLAQQLQALKKAGAAAGSSSKKAAGVGAGSSKSSSKKSSGRT